MSAMSSTPEIDTVRPLSVAVLAMGGQGGGVLVDWIVALAEGQGWVAQSTSVPGVAQRTGATIYYIELIKPRPGMAYPILALMPAPGEVDLVVGAELMEAGRSMLRGLVSSDRTTLITSSHRSYAVQEKIVPGDGIAEVEPVYTAAHDLAARFVAFDMAEVAEKTGSVVSSVLFGAVAASGALPFPREAFEETIREAGVGVAPSLRAFAAGFERATHEVARGPFSEAPPPAPKPARSLAPVGNAAFDRLVEDVGARFPAALHDMLAAGLQRVVDYQDIAYGREYLDLVAGFLPLEAAGRHDLTRAAAKYVAVAMAYDDVIRVADLKTRASRFARVRSEVAAKDDQIVYTTEFMHPRMEEVAGTLPAGLGLWLEGKPGLWRTLDRLVNRGRRVRTGTIRWFLPLYVVAGLRGRRRGTLRHRREVTHRDAWLDLARSIAPTDYELAVEILEARRLVKGYSDTHARGHSKFDRVIEAGRRLHGREDAATWLRRLREIALKDESDAELKGALATIDSFL